jgi:N-methylhydantoinase B/oxoprolinase/acetone carboxylase alpha subunit
MSLDPITFEVIRNRLWAINDNQGRTAARLSGSPVVYEAFDFNAALTTADGRGLYSGVYILEHAAIIDVFVRKLLDEWGPDGIRPGDMFFTNDPWSGALHANDGILAGPIFHGDTLVAWSGIVMHDSDVGSPVPGSFVVGATDRFGEAPLFPGVRMVENGELRHDIEAAYLRNHRTPELNALSLRARVAAIRATEQQIGELVDQYGLDALVATGEGIIRYVEGILRQRLLAIPDGEWTEEVYLDHDGTTPAVYTVRCTLTKRGDRLTLDYAGTSPQAPGPINCARPAMEGAVFCAFFIALCHDLPWCVGAGRAIVEILSEEGTLNNATGAAPTSMASIMGTVATRDAASRAFARMLMGAGELRDEVQANWKAGVNVNVHSGVDRHGELFAMPLLDCMGGGGGARTFGDGVDTGGSSNAQSATIPNVETTESRMAVLQLYRREACDSAGPGRFRGGVGIEWAIMPHKCQGPLGTVVAASGVSHPNAQGLSGGGPASVHANVVYRDTDVLAMLAGGRVPASGEELAYAIAESQQAKDRTTLEAGDVMTSGVSGGGGYGDPLRREPELVARDVRHGLVSTGVAERVYGVVLNGEGVDAAASSAAREHIRGARLAQATAPMGAAASRVEGGEIAHPVLDTVDAVRVDGELVEVCSVCRHRFGPAGGSLAREAAVLDLPITDTSPHNAHGDGERFGLRQWCCPGCGTALHMDVVRKEVPG